MSQPDFNAEPDALRASLAAWLVARHGLSPTEALQRHGADAMLATTE